MFIAFVRFPDIPVDHDVEFRHWFDWSNQELAGAPGLRGRRLLRSSEGGYAALVEHETAASFAAMHETPPARKVQARLHALVPEAPQATQFEVVAQLASAGCCMGGDAGHHDHGLHSAVGAATGRGAGQACCHGESGHSSDSRSS